MKYSNPTNQHHRLVFCLPAHTPELTSHTECAIASLTAILPNVRVILF